MGPGIVGGGVTWNGGVPHLSLFPRSDRAPAAGASRRRPNAAAPAATLRCSELTVCGLDRRTLREECHRPFRFGVNVFVDRRTDVTV